MTTLLNDKEVLRSALLKVGSFSDRDIETVLAHLTLVTLEKDERLLREGSVCGSLYLLLKGSMRHYRVTDEGDEITLNLFVEGEWMMDHQSITSQKPSHAIIVACENCAVYALSIHDLHALMKTSDAFFQVGRIFQYGVAQQEANFKTAPKERYGQLLLHKPHILQRFPLKYIASYLDMTPETLSRVRRHLAS